MIDLPPALKADLSLVLQDLLKDTGGLLDIKLSDVGGWCDDRAIDLDSLCSYVANLCGENQIDFEHLRAATDNIIRSGATTKQFLELVDDLEPELLKELVTQASIASTDLEKMNNEAGGNKTFHWIANHPFASAGIGLGAVVVTGGIVHKLRQIRQAERFVDNGAQHVENGVHDLNERLVEGVNTHVDHEITNISGPVRDKLDEHLRKEEYSKVRDLLTGELRNKTLSGQAISRSEPYFRKETWDLDLEVTQLNQAHWLKWPEQQDAGQKEYSGPLLRKLYPTKYLSEFRHWEREEKRMADKLLISKKPDVSEQIDHAQSEMQHLENRELLNVEQRLVHDKAHDLIENSNYNLDAEFSRSKLLRFDMQKTLRAEDELLSIDRAVFKKFEESNHFGGLFELMKEEDARFWDFGMVQFGINLECRSYYALYNKEYFDINKFPTGEGVIKLDEDIIRRYRHIDSKEVQDIRDLAYRNVMISNYKHFDTDMFCESSEIIKTKEFRDNCLKMFGTINNIDKWLDQQKGLLRRHNKKPFAGVSGHAKLKQVSEIIEYRVQESYSILRSEAYSTLKQYSGKAEQDLTKAEHDIMNKAFKDLERSNMLASYFKSEFDAAVKTLESEAAALLNDGKQEADALMQASERDAADILKSVEII